MLSDQVLALQQQPILSIPLPPPHAALPRRIPLHTLGVGQSWRSSPGMFPHPGTRLCPMDRSACANKVAGTGPHGSGLCDQIHKAGLDSEATTATNAPFQDPICPVTASVASLFHPPHPTLLAYLCQQPLTICSPARGPSAGVLAAHKFTCCHSVVYFAIKQLPLVEWAFHWWLAQI